MMDMVSYDELRGQNAKRPFSPFWVKLTDGEMIIINAPNMAVVTKQRFDFTPDRRRIRHIPFEKIDSHGLLPATT